MLALRLSNLRSKTVAKAKGVTWKQVVEMAAEYPGVVEKSSYGTPGLYVRKQFMARLREPDVMVLKPIHDDEQKFLMETSPDAFFLTDHYRGYPTVLIRMSKVDRRQLAELIEGCWRQLATKRLLAAQSKGQTAEGKEQTAKSKQQTAKSITRAKTVAK